MNRKLKTQMHLQHKTSSCCTMSTLDIQLLRHVAKSRPALPATLPKDVPCELGEASMRRLLMSGAVEKNANRLVLTSQGKQALRRIKLAKDEEQIYASQHQDRESIPSQTSEQDKGRSYATRKVNHAESPLSMLARKKREDGSAYLSGSQCAAGERLRADFERGNIVPSMGINWDRLGEAIGSVSKNARMQHNSRDLPDSAGNAQQRFRNAVDFVGEEFSGALIDFCCFLKGLEEIERTHHWPARSAKQILALALSRLARHYGFSEEATGPKKATMRHWGTQDYRPNI